MGWNDIKISYLFSWLDFANKGLWKRVFTSTAGMPMANYADTEEASIAAATAVKGPV